MKKERVILIHGLGENSLVMMAIGNALTKAGYATSYLDYPSTRYPAEELLEKYVAPFCRQFSNETLHFVTHSLGGVLLRAWLLEDQPSNIGRIVMQAPGHRGSDMLDMYSRSWLFRAAFGPASRQSGIDEQSFSLKLSENLPGYEIGIIAGCLPSDPLSYLMMSWPHDGKVRVESTKLKTMTDHIVLPAGHDGITFDVSAIYQTKHFLQHGNFYHLVSRTKAA